MTSEMFRKCCTLFNEMITIIKTPDLGEPGLDTAMDIIHEIEMRLRAHPACHARQKARLAKGRKMLGLKIKRHEEIRRLRAENARLRLEMKIKKNKERHRLQRVEQGVQNRFKMPLPPHSATKKPTEGGDEYHQGFKRKRGVGFAKDSEAQSAGDHPTKQLKGGTTLVKKEFIENEVITPTIKNEYEEDEVITPTIKKECTEENNPIIAIGFHHCTLCGNRWETAWGQVETICPHCKNHSGVIFASKQDKMKTYESPSTLPFNRRTKNPELGYSKRSGRLSDRGEAKLKHLPGKTPGINDTSSAIKAFSSK